MQIYIQKVDKFIKCTEIVKKWHINQELLEKYKNEI